MQIIGQGAPEKSPPARPQLAAAVIALTVAVAGTVLFAGRGHQLPADQAEWTPLETAERFNELYEQGRVAEFLDLVSPQAVWCQDAACTRAAPFFGGVYRRGFQTAFESQYLAATGGTLGAECVATGPTVDCEWHQTNVLFTVGEIDPWVGPQSFTVEDGLITHYRGGYQWEGVLVWDRPEQNLYSDWLEATYPEEYPHLFEDQLMLVFTEENRDRHRELIDEWAKSQGF